MTTEASSNNAPTTHFPRNTRAAGAPLLSSEGNMAQKPSTKKQSRSSWQTLSTAALIALFAWVTSSISTQPLVGVRAANKPYTTFSEFYPFYLSEHSDLTNRRLHFAGTTGVLLILLSSPDALQAIVAAGSLGYLLCGLLSFIPHGFVEMAIVISVFIFVYRKLSGMSITFTLGVSRSITILRNFQGGNSHPSSRLFVRLGGPLRVREEPSCDVHLSNILPDG